MAVCLQDVKKTSNKIGRARIAWNNGQTKGRKSSTISAGKKLTEMSIDWNETSNTRGPDFSSKPWMFRVPFKVYEAQITWTI